jgi:large repetitive protein
LNSQGCPTYASPDLGYVSNSLTVNTPTCPDRDFTISFRITNQGDVPLDGTVPISFYNGNPTLPGAIKLNTVQVVINSLSPSTTVQIPSKTVNGPGSPFTLYIVLNDGGTTVPTPISLPNTNFVECDYANNIISVAINPHTATLQPVKLADNIKCVATTSPDNGAARVYVVDGATENTADYNFFWFHGTTIDNTPDHTGPSYSGLAEGTYTIYAVHKTASCSSDTATVTINRIDRTLSVAISLISPVTDCKNPNGQMKAVVNNGNEPSTNFDFTWYEGNVVLVGKPIGVAEIATDLKENSAYAVYVVDKLSGCPIAGSLTTNVLPKPTVSANTNDAICSSTNSGSASANVGGNTTNFTFEWARGSTPKPTPDFTGVTYSGLTTGDYTVVATTNSSHCSSQPLTVTVALSPAPSINAVVDAHQTSCDPTRPNGAVSSSATGGSGNYSFEWFKGQNTLTANRVSTSNTATGLDVGIYTAKVTDTSTGCSTTGEVTIALNIGPAPVLNATPTHQTQCVPTNGMVTASISVGSVTDYTYSWYTGTSVDPTKLLADTDHILNNVQAGSYTVTAIHKTNFCAAAARTFTVVDNSPAISIAVNTAGTRQPNDCNDKGSLALDVSAPGNTLGFRAEWYSGRVPDPTGHTTIWQENVLTTTKTPDVPATPILGVGVYTVYVTDLNTGCRISREFTMTFADLQEVTVSANDVLVCPPNSIGTIDMQLTPGINDPGATGTSVYDQIGVAGPFSTTATLAPGLYTVVAVSILPTGCRSIPQLVEIKQTTTNPAIIFSPSIANTQCTTITGNGRVSANIGGGIVDYQFDWTNDQTLATFTGDTWDLIPPGTYTVKVTDIHTAANTNCFSTAHTFVSNDPISVSAAVDPTSLNLIACDATTGNPQGSAIISDVKENGTNVPNPFNDYTFTWKDNGQVPFGTSTITSQLINAGTYYLTVENTEPTATAFGCTTTVQFEMKDQTKGSTTVRLDIDPDNSHNPKKCLVDPANLDESLGKLTVIAGGNSTTGYDFEWYSGSPLSSAVPITPPNTTATLSNIAVAVNTTSMFTIKVVNQTNGCWASDSYGMKVDVNTVMTTVSSSPVTFCSQNNGIVFGTVINDVSSNQQYQHEWTGAIQQNTLNTQINGLGMGSYTMIARDPRDPNICISQPKTVILEDRRVYPIATATESSPLTNCDLTKANGVAKASVNGNDILYDFDWYTGSPSNSQSFYSGSQANGLADGQYTVVATDRITGCTGATQVTVTRNPLVIPNPEITILSDITSCLVNNGSLSAAVNGETGNYLFNWYLGNAAKSATDYTGEIIKDLNIGFYTVTATSRITGCISAPDTEELTKKQIFPDFDFKITPASCEANNGSATLFMTNDAAVDNIVWTGNGEQVFGPNLSDVPVGTYDVTVTSQLGCETTKTIAIETDVRPYNGVSRNGDGVNDFFYINCITQFPGNHVKIFNRAGTVVFETRDYNNIDIYFDGKSNKGISPLGNNLPDGTYYYVIDKGDGSKPVSGYLELVN